MTEQMKMDPEMLSIVLDTISRLERERITLETRLELDHDGEFPTDLIRFMLGPEVALHLIFIPADYGGLGAGAMDIAIVSERLAKKGPAVAPDFLSICFWLGPT